MFLAKNVQFYEMNNNFLLQDDKVKIFIKIENPKLTRIKETSISEKYGKIIKTKKIEIYFTNKLIIKIRKVRSE